MNFNFLGMPTEELADILEGEKFAGLDENKKGLVREAARRLRISQRERDYRRRIAIITVTLYHDKVESDDSLRSSIVQELDCCHCVDSVNKIEII